METLEVINQRLIDYWGKSHRGLANWRVVWSTDQIEKRWTDRTREGFQCEPYVALLPKYKQYKPDKWVLERYLDVPPNMQTDLVENFSYEPLFFFEDVKEFPLPYKWEVINFVIWQVNKAAAEAVGKKYFHNDPLAGLTEEEQRIAYDEELRKIGEEYFGNETDISTAIQHKEGIFVP